MEENEALMETNRIAHMPAVEAMHSKQFKMSLDLVKKAIEDYSPKARNELWWAARFCSDYNLSTAQFASRLLKEDGEPYHKDTFEAAIKGRKSVTEVETIVSAIAEYRKIVEQREGMAQTTFVETRLVRRIHDLCRRTFLRQKMTLIYGESQIGKTISLEEYARRNNHGRTIMVRMPTGGAIGIFIAELARVLNISVQQRQSQVRHRITECFDSNMLLIVDECHQCMAPGVNSGYKTLDFIREIHDRAKCGVVLCGTNAFRDGMTRGPQSKALQQIFRRCYRPLQLPDVPTDENLNDFAESLGLEPAPNKKIRVNVINEEALGLGIERFDANPREVQSEIIAKHGLGRWLNILQEAADDAREEKKAISWGRVMLIHKMGEKFCELKDPSKPVQPEPKERK